MGGERAGLWGRVSAVAVQRPLITLLGGVALLGALALGLVGVGTTGFGDVTGGPAGSDSAAGQAALNAHFPGSSVNQSLILFRIDQPIWSHLGTLDKTQQALATDSYLASAVGPLNPNGITLTSARIAQLHRQLGAPQRLPRQEPSTLQIPPLEYNAYRSLSQFISPDGRTVQWASVLRYNHDTTQDLAKIPPLRDSIAGIGRSVGATATGVFGQIALAYDVSHISTDDLFRIIPVVAVVIAILLALVLRSLVAPLYLVASVVLSYLAALGFAAIVFVHLGTQSGLNFVLPFLVFIFLTALGSDYNILVMTRIREEAQQMPLRKSVPHAIGVSGTTVTTAGMILAGTFAVLGVAAGNQQGADQIRQIGFGIAAGVLMDTFLIRTLLVPSMVILLGRWNWWPSRLFRHPVEEQAAPSRAERPRAAVGA
jgi:RND superfamily putative drug exporter